jgi:putative ABC transport system ATP-binding protein
MTARLEADGVCRSYESDGVTVGAVVDVDLEVAAGEFVAIMGPSGSGKSTLLYLLGGLDRPTAGEVRIDGVALSSLSRHELAHVRGRRVGFVFQMFNLVAGLTVEENVALPAVIARQRASAYRDRLSELLATVGLEGRRRSTPAQLSGGEQQRVAIARALIMDPAVVLADEPTGNLDSQSGAEVMGLLGRCRDAGRTIVLVTHDAKVASHADRIVHLRDGRVVQETPLDVGARASMGALVQTGEPS